MRNNVDMHSDEWWMRAFDSALSPEEERLWQVHLTECETCRVEWEAMARVDMLLRTAPPPPALSEAFTAKTAKRAMQKQRLRRLLNFLAGTVIVALVAWLVIGFLGSTFDSLERVVNAVISGRQVLFTSMTRALVALVLSWKSVLPLILAISGIACLFLMPNSILATMAVFWLSRRRRAGDAAA